MSFCGTCGAQKGVARFCPNCGAMGPDAGTQFGAIGGPTSQSMPPPPPSKDDSKKLAAGLCGILIGSLGIHKFLLGYRNEGLVMLLVTLLTCFIGAIPMGIIGLIEGIIYLSKSEDEFYKTYVVGRKGWF